LPQPIAAHLEDVLSKSEERRIPYPGKDNVALGLLFCVGKNLTCETPP